MMPMTGEEALNMTDDLRMVVETSKFDTEQVARKGRLVYENALRKSPYLDSGNFTAIHTTDLRRLFDEYDDCFFESQIGTTLRNIPLGFRLSRRMTSVAGKTARYGGSDCPGGSRYEISVSTELLFQCFRNNDDRPITVVGIACSDRLEALQRVMEHELVHLLELVLWSTSSCSTARFQAIASRFFSHESHTHQLMTPRERALQQFGIRPGAYVRFKSGSVYHLGTVTRVTKRATVLVGDFHGTLFSDGRKYTKYYVPVERLEVVTKCPSG
jgi:hypothetical protein